MCDVISSHLIVHKYNHVSQALQETREFKRGGRLRTGLLCDFQAEHGPYAGAPIQQTPETLQRPGAWFESKDTSYIGEVWGAPDTNLSSKCVPCKRMSQRPDH